MSNNINTDLVFGEASLTGTAIRCSDVSPFLDVVSGFEGKGGKVVYSDKMTEVKVGSTLSVDGKETEYKDAIAIKVKCTKDPHTVQFINREIIGSDGKHVSQKMYTTGGEYMTTTDPAKPNWNTDSAAKPEPHYETAGASSSDKDGLTIYDQPSLRPERGQTWRATFKTFLICDGKVIREVTWVRSQKDGELPKYDAHVREAHELPAWATQQMKAQGYDAPL